MGVRHNVRTMKALTLSLLAVLSLASLSLASTAHAEIDNACDVHLQKNGEEIVSDVIYRQSKAYFGDDLILAFTADYYAGQESDQALFMIQDRHDKHVIKVESDTISKDWDWAFQVPTAYGLVSVRCR